MVCKLYQNRENKTDRDVLGSREKLCFSSFASQPVPKQKAIVPKTEHNL